MRSKGFPRKPLVSQKKHETVIILGGWGQPIGAKRGHCTTYASPLSICFSLPSRLATTLKTRFGLPLSSRTRSGCQAGPPMRRNDCSVAYTHRVHVAREPKGQLSGRGRLLTAPRQPDSRCEAKHATAMPILPRIKFQTKLLHRGPAVSHET